MFKLATFDGPRKIKLTQETRKPCGSGNVLVRVAHCGICGSDLHMYRGARDQPSNSPGHEFSGVVIETGPEVVDIKVGDRICVEAFSHCKECGPCCAGTYNLCEKRVFIPHAGHGGFSEIAEVHESSLFRLPENIDFETGALVEPLAVAYHAIKKIPEGASSRLLILGAGTIGLCMVLLAALLGLKEVAIVAKYRHQKEAAERAGITNVILANGKPLPLSWSQFDCVINTIATDEAVNLSVEACRRGGTIILTGGYSACVPTSLRQLVSKEISMIGSICYATENGVRIFDTIIHLLASNALDPAFLVTHRYSLDDIGMAFKVSDDKENLSIKVQVIVNEMT